MTVVPWWYVQVQGGLQRQIPSACFRKPIERVEEQKVGKKILRGRPEHIWRNGRFNQKSRAVRIVLVLGDHRKELMQNPKMNKDTWARGRQGRALFTFWRSVELILQAVELSADNYSFYICSQELPDSLLFSTKTPASPYFIHHTLHMMILPRNSSEHSNDSRNVTLMYSNYNITGHLQKWGNYSS